MVIHCSTSFCLQDIYMPRKARQNIAYIIFCMNIYKKEAKINGHKIVKIYGPVNWIWEKWNLKKHFFHYRNCAKKILWYYDIKMTMNKTEEYVLWSVVSIFLDARGGNHIPSSVGDVRSHWVDTALFKTNRVVFDTSPSPDKAKLKIFNVSESDDGLYRCRVDFKMSQTRTSRLNLTVVGKRNFNFITL